MTRIHTPWLSRAALCAALGFATGAHAATLKILYHFNGHTDGGTPGGPLLRDNSGNLYGTAGSGGRGGGLIFKLAPTSSGPWALSILYKFPGGAGGLVANPGLSTDSNRTLYGSAYSSKGGAAFSLAPPASAGGAWRYTTLANFPGITSPLGSAPNGAPTIAADGTLIGSTNAGGDQQGQFPCQCGVIYALPPAHGARSEQVLHTFQPLPDGNNPAAPLTADGPNTLFGTTNVGGTGKCLDGSSVYVVGCGTVFALTHTTTGWAEQVIY